MSTTAHNPRQPVEVATASPDAVTSHVVTPVERAAPRSHTPQPGAGVESPRLEIKAVLRDFELPHALTELRLSTLALRRHFPPRTVQSIYLDTHDARALWENVSGICERQKTRFRWYGVQSEAATGTLELKVRADRLGWKRTFPVSTPLRIVGAPRAEFVREIRNQAPPSFAEVFAQAIEPALWIAYEREYFVTSNGRVRVTADRNLRSFDLRDAPTITDSRRLPMARLAVLEFKAAPWDERLIDELLARFPLITHRCSKYVMAGSPADGPLAPL